MRKWQNLAPPDDKDSWYDVDGMWPTNRGSYETCDFASDTSITATGRGASVGYAWAGKSGNGTSLEYVIDSSHVWQYSSGALTDKTGGIAVVASAPCMAQLGNVVVLTMGPSTPSAASSAPGATFATLGAMPKAAMCCVQTGAVIVANTSTAGDGFQTSDLGDHTNWTTGESFSTRIYQVGGSITAMVPFADAVILFKENGIFRARYTGGNTKWAVDTLWLGIGCYLTRSAIAGATGILYAGYTRTDAGSPSCAWMWFDGVNRPIFTNPYTDIPGGVPYYDPVHDRFMVQNSTNGCAYFFDPRTMQWGRSTAYDAGVPLDGSGAGRSEASSTITSYTTIGAAADKIIRRAVSTGATGTAGTCYVQTAMFGRPDRKSTFKRATPILRRRTDLGSGTTALEVTTYRERYSSSAQNTLSVAKSSFRDRYDIDSQTGATDNFARVKLTFTNYDVEIDDIAVTMVDAGED